MPDFRDPCILALMFMREGHSDCLERLDIADQWESLEISYGSSCFIKLGSWVVFSNESRYWFDSSITQCDNAPSASGSSYEDSFQSWTFLRPVFRFIPWCPWSIWSVYYVLALWRIFHDSTSVTWPMAGLRWLFHIKLFDFFSSRYTAAGTFPNTVSHKSLIYLSTFHITRRISVHSIYFLVTILTKLSMFML